jgi:branched-chain amino acid transport system substrate-binding protein
VGGCASTANTSATVSGTTLTVYASVPSQATDVLDAEKLALSQAGSTVGKFRVVLEPLTADSIKQVADNARAADENKTTIAYLGETVPGLSEQSVPITNELGILEVSPTDNALELTSASPVVPNSQNVFYPSKGTYGYTFGRVVPSDRIEAEDLVGEMRSVGVTKLYVANDGSDYGLALAHAVQADARASLTATPGPPSAANVTSSGADGVFYGGSSPSAAATFFDAVAAASPKLKLFGPSSLDSAAFAGDLAAGAQPNVYVSAPGFLRADLPAAGLAFEKTFASTYGHSPAPQAIFGFAAMKAVLDALHDAGTAANDRTTVANDFFTLNVQQSAIGPFKMRENGDNNLTAIVFSRIRGGKLVPFKS